MAWPDNDRACLWADQAEVLVAVAEDIRDWDNADFAKEILNGSRIMNSKVNKET